MAPNFNSIFKNLILPILLWAVIVLVFSNAKYFTAGLDINNTQVAKYIIKCIFMVIFPLVVIYILYDFKSHFGIYFPKFSDSFILALRAFAVAGPAGITFLVIGWFGWKFNDWYGGTTLAVAYAIAFYFVAKATRKIPVRPQVHQPNKGILIFSSGSIFSCIIAYATFDSLPIFSKILYYIFMVGLGEELLFRGYIQSSFNRVLKKNFSFFGVQFGWGMILAAILFGLMHALVVAPPAWPWAIFTCSMGLTLGFIREKDGSILSAALLHAMMDMPLAFMT